MRQGQGGARSIYRVISTGCASCQGCPAPGKELGSRDILFNIKCLHEQAKLPRTKVSAIETLCKGFT